MSTRENVRKQERTQNLEGKREGSRNVQRIQSATWQIVTSKVKGNKDCRSPIKLGDWRMSDRLDSIACAPTITVVLVVHRFALLLQAPNVQHVVTTTCTCTHDHVSVQMKCMNIETQNSNYASKSTLMLAVIERNSSRMKSLTSINRFNYIITTVIYFFSKTLEF